LGLAVTKIKEIKGTYARPSNYISCALRAYTLCVNRHIKDQRLTGSRNTAWARSANTQARTAKCLSIHFSYILFPVTDHYRELIGDRKEKEM
jgi:hypothetical protein